MEETSYETYLANHPDPDLEPLLVDSLGLVDLDAVVFQAWTDAAALDGDYEDFN